MDRAEHGRQRAGKIGASVAPIIDRGGKRAWDTLAKNLWADETGEAFAAKVTGAREYGHEHEAEGAAKFWTRHPEFELVDDVGWMASIDTSVLGQYIGASPDRLLSTGGAIIGGLEVKSPTTVEAMAQHTVKEHRAQCGHSMLVTNLPVWYLVAHHGERYAETMLLRDTVWEAQYIRKLYAFLQLLNEGKHVRRRLTIGDLDKR